jgi:hypothetical protein
VLAQLKSVKIIITTNYDRMIEEEAQKYRRLTWHYYSRIGSEIARFDHSPSIRPDEVVVYKMHGTIEKPETMVISESDYIYYLTHIYDRERGIPDFFRKTWLPYCNLLFLGYNLEALGSEFRNLILIDKLVPIFFLPDFQQYPNFLEQVVLVFSCLNTRRRIDACTKDYPMNIRQSQGIFHAGLAEQLER